MCRARSRSRTIGSLRLGRRTHNAATASPHRPTADRARAPDSLEGNRQRRHGPALCGRFPLCVLASVIRPPSRKSVGYGRTSSRSWLGGSLALIADGVTQDGADHLIRPIPRGPIGMKILEQVIHLSSSLWCFVSLPPGEDDCLIIGGGAPVVCYAQDRVGVTFGTPMTPGVAV